MGPKTSQSYIPVPQIEQEQSEAENIPENFELESLHSINSNSNTRLESLNHNVEEEPNEQNKSNMRMAFMNMANSILGAGIIGQPYAFKNIGVVGGIIVIIILAFVIDWTLRLIVINANISQTRSYQDTVSHCYGIRGRALLLISISSFAYGGCMAFCVIIGDTIPHVLKAFIPTAAINNTAISWLFHRNFIIIIFTTCISYPLSLNRDISKLAKASGFALLGMLIIVIITIARGPFVEADLKGTLSTSQWIVDKNIFQGISVISFALVCHHNTIFIYNSLERATIEKFSKLTHIACLVSMICCLTMGLIGFLYFGDVTKGNILNNFKGDDNWINVARFFFGLNMLTTFPLEIFVVRDVLKDIIFLKQTLGESTSHLELSANQHFFITTFLVFSSMAVSLFTCNLGIILELIGSTSASLMAYIIPPMCYLKLKWNEVDYKNLNFQQKRKFIFTTIVPSVACTIFGFVIMIISSSMSIEKSWNDKDSGQCVID